MAIDSNLAQATKKPLKEVIPGFPLTENSRLNKLTFQHTDVDGVEIAWTETGDPEGVPVLMVMGLGASYRLWGDQLVFGLAHAGHRVFLLDNRDVGKSQRFDHMGEPNLWFSMLKYHFGLPLDAPYTLKDMANDAVGLMETLGVENYHVVGASLGGMIAQVIAAEYPERVRSLVSMMSTTGAKHLPKSKLNALNMVRRLLNPPKEYIDDMFEAGLFPEALRRQSMAVFHAGDRSESVKTIKADTLVLHGTDDILLPVGHGEHTSQLIPNSKLVTIDGLGHEMPEKLQAEVLEHIVNHFARVESKERIMLTRDGQIQMKNKILSTVGNKAGAIPFIWGHGLMASMSMDNDIQFLDFSKLKDFTLVRYDACGHGESPNSEFPYQTHWTKLADDMIAVADQQSIDRCVVGGASMGSATALHAGLKYPERVAGLVLVIPPTAWESREKIRKIYRFISTLSKFGLAASFLKLMLRFHRLVPEYLADHFDQYQQAIKRHAEAFCAKNPLAVLLGAADSDLPMPNEISNIMQPTLILAWKDDPAHPVQVARELHQLLPNSQLHIADSIDDFLNWSDQIATFLQTISMVEKKEQNIESV